MGTCVQFSAKIGHVGGVHSFSLHRVRSSPLCVCAHTEDVLALSSAVRHPARPHSPRGILLLSSFRSAAGQRAADTRAHQADGRLLYGPDPVFSDRAPIAAAIRPADSALP